MSESPRVRQTCVVGEVSCIHARLLPGTVTCRHLLALSARACYRWDRPISTKRRWFAHLIFTWHISLLTGAMRF